MGNSNDKTKKVGAQMNGEQVLESLREYPGVAELVRIYDEVSQQGSDFLSYQMGMLPEYIVSASDSSCATEEEMEIDNNADLESNIKRNI